MGIIEKQATRNAINSYIGAALGFLTLLWMPRLLNTEENGLIRILLSFATLFAQFSNLGFSAVLIRLFPHFRNKENGNNGFLFYAIVIPCIGFIISSIFFLIFREQIVSNNIEKSKLLVDYLYYLVPLAFFILFFNIFDTYLRAGFNSVLGSSSKEVIQRVLILIILSLYFFKFISFHAFIFLYTIAVSISTLILVFYIVSTGDWNIKPNSQILTPQLRTQAIKLSLFTLLSEFSAGLIVTIDTIMLNHILGLSKTGIYGVAFNFGNLMTIPARSISRITSSIIVENFKKNDLKEIASLYKKSCNSQLTIGSLLLVGVILNIHNIMWLLPVEYQSGQSIIIILCIGYFIELATGLNHTIVVFSKYYNYDSYFIFSLVFVALLLNYIFIQLYGMTGAALATASVTAFGNIARSLFVYFKFKMQPYDRNSLKIVAVGGLCLLIGYFIPYLLNVFVDTLVRSLIVVCLFMLLILKAEAAPEISAKIRKNLKRFSINI